MSEYNASDFVDINELDPLMVDVYTLDGRRLSFKLRSQGEASDAVSIIRSAFRTWIEGR